MTTFPALRPSSREFIAGVFPVAAPEYQGVDRYSKLVGTQAVDHRLILDYLNIADTEATAILDCYRESFSGFKSIELSSEIFSDIKLETLITEMLGRVDWYFAEKPSVESVFVGISTVRVNLKGVLN